MSRYLFVVPPLVGHINPTLAVAEQLARRGHEVAWAGHERRPAVAPGAGLPGLPGLRRPASTPTWPSSARDWQELKGVAALKFFWQEFVLPLGRAMLPGVERAIDRVPARRRRSPTSRPSPGRWRPCGRGLPWVTSATTLGRAGPSAARPAQGGGVGAGSCRPSSSGTPGLDRSPVDLRFSDRLVLCFTTTELIGPRPVLPRPLRLHRPGDDRPAAVAVVPLGPARPRPAVGSSCPSAASTRRPGKRFFGIAAEALGDVVQLIMVAPAGHGRATPPGGAIVAEWVPQLELLPHVDAVVSHAGHNTVVEALAHGLPQVVAPIRDDQPVVAQQIEASGAGIRVRFGRLRAPRAAPRGHHRARRPVLPAVGRAHPAVVRPAPGARSPPPTTWRRWSHEPSSPATWPTSTSTSPSGPTPIPSCASPPSCTSRSSATGPA